LYSSPNVIRIVKLRRMSWAGHIAHVGKKRNAYRVWVGKKKERDHQEYLDIGRSTILK
jgi:hypothetical protein